MQSEEKRLEHVASLNIDENCLGWTIVLMNRGPKAVNDSLFGYHWVVGIISPEGQVFYGDPLNSVEVPKNFHDMVNPYYKARFGEDIPDVFNCSDVEMFPNFPKQLSDAHICGFVGLLVMLLAKEPRYLQFILSGNKLDSSGLDFINFPGKYPIYLKQIFQVLYVEKKIPNSLLITRAEIKRMVKQSSLWAKLPFSRSKQITARIPGLPLAEHLNASSPGHFKSKLKLKKNNVHKKSNEVAEQPYMEVADKPEMEVAEQPNMEVAEQPNMEVAEQPDMEVSEQPDMEVAEQPDMEVAEQPDMEVPGQGLTDVSNHQTEDIAYDGKFLGDKFFEGNTSILNNDGYNWKPKGKKKGAKYFQEYICTEDCQGTKFAKKQNHWDFGGKFGTVWKVKYTVDHACQRNRSKKDMQAKKSSHSSYILGRIENHEPTDTLLKPRKLPSQSRQKSVVTRNKKKMQERRNNTLEPSIQAVSNEVEKDSKKAQVSDDADLVVSHGQDEGDADQCYGGE